MTTKKDVHDQAEQLRQKIVNSNQHRDDQDILSLPPRSEVHKNKKKKTKWKIKYPVVRLLALFFILLPISILSIYYLNDKKTEEVTTFKPSESYETVDIDEQESEQADDSETSRTDDTDVEGAVNVPASVDRQPSVQTEENGEAVTDESGQEVITHTVKQNETLFSIAMKYYQTDKGMEIIKEWNNLKNSQLHEGQVLKIPLIDMSK